jgi:hypothetical protein
MVKDWVGDNRAAKRSDASTPSHSRFAVAVGRHHQWLW